MALCECGCGQPTAIATITVSHRGWRKGEPKRFVIGHSSRVVRRGDGLDAYPKRDGKLLHVRMAESALGKPLPDGAQVHHVDGVMSNSVRGNLVICQDHAYHRLLHVRTRVIQAGGNPNTQRICSRCKELRDRLTEFYQKPGRSDGRESYCKACSSALVVERKKRRRLAATAA